MVSTSDPPKPEASAVRREIYMGAGFNVPEDPANVVRIFLSSTFSDFIHERNVLFNNAVPELEIWCRERGFEFQIVDLRWGLRDVVIREKGGVTLCINEVKNCQKVSAGANFVALIGDRYGRRPIPFTIPKSEFDLITKRVQNKSDLEFLNQYFLIDSNAVPAEYIFNTAKLLVKQSNQKSDKGGKDELRRIEMKLQEILQTEISAAAAAKEIDEHSAQKYFTSVTEQEIWTGILTIPEPEKHAICFIRNFVPDSITRLNQDSKASLTYIDVVASPSIVQRDGEATRLLANLKNFLIPQVLDDGNIVVHQLEADTNLGINPNDKLHREYLFTLENKFTHMVKTLVRNGMVARQQESISDPLYKEIIQHAAFCARKLEIYCGQDELLTTVFKKLGDPEFSSPLVLYGESGCGKTATIAKLIQTARLTIPNKPIVIYRFLGTTPKSSTIDQVFWSLSAQISACYQLNTNLEEEPNYNILRTKFMAILEAVSQHAAKRPLLIVLEAVDQLSAAYSAHTMHWVPIQLPRNVKLLLSTMPSYQNLLPKLQARLKPEAFIGMKQISSDNTSQLMNSLLAKNKRTLLDNQLTYVESVLKRSLNPLLLQLTYTEAARWHSFTPESELVLGETIKEAIGVLFDRLERDHGKCFLKQALSFIVAARNGLSENEIEDLLSLDNQVLSDVYQYWKPPNEEVIAIPPMLWTRLRIDFEDFFVVRQADDTTVMALYHKQFSEVVLQRYLHDANQRNYVHKLLSEYFDGTYSTTPKPLTLTVNGVRHEYRSMRRVRSQPMQFGSGRHNLRKLNELPYHLAKSGGIDKLFDEILTDFKWILAKITACGMRIVVLDYDMLIKDDVLEDDNQKACVHCIRNALRLIQTTIEYKDNENNFACELLSRMSQVATQPNLGKIQRLLDGAKAWIENDCKETIFVPENQYLMAPSGQLVASLLGHSGNIRALAYDEDHKLLISSGDDETLIVYDLEQDSVNHVIEQKKARIDAMCFDELNERLICVCQTGNLITYDVKSGSEITKIDLRPFSDQAPKQRKATTKQTASPLSFSGISQSPGKVFKKSTFISLYGTGESHLAIIWSSQIFLLVNESHNEIVQHFKSNASNLIKSAAGDSTGFTCSLGGTKVLVHCPNQSPRVIDLVDLRDPLCGLVKLPGRNCALLVGEQAKAYNARLVSISKGDQKEQEIFVWTGVTSESPSILHVYKDKCFAVASRTRATVRYFDEIRETVVSGGIGYHMNSSINTVCLTELAKSVCIIIGCSDESVRIFDASEHNSSLRFLLPGLWGSPNHVLEHDGLLITASYRASVIKLWRLDANWCNETPIHAPDMSITRPAVRITGSGKGARDFVCASVDSDSRIHLATSKIISENVLKNELMAKDVFMLHLITDDRLLVGYKSGFISCIENVTRPAKEIKEVVWVDKLGEVDHWSLCDSTSSLLILGNLHSQPRVQHITLKSKKVKDITPGRDFEWPKNIEGILELPNDQHVLRYSNSIQVFQGIIPYLTIAEHITCLVGKDDMLALAIPVESRESLTTTENSIQVWNTSRKAPMNFKVIVPSDDVTCMAIESTSKSEHYLLIGTSKDSRTILMYSLSTGAKIRSCYMYSPIASIVTSSGLTHMCVVTQLGCVALFRLKFAAVNSTTTEVPAVEHRPKSSSPTLSSTGCGRNKTKSCTIL